LPLRIAPPAGVERAEMSSSASSIGPEFLYLTLGSRFRTGARTARCPPTTGCGGSA